MKFSNAHKHLLLLAILANAAGQTLIGQGLVSFQNTSSTLVQTNSAGLGGTTGPTFAGLNGFTYGLFTAPSTVNSLSPLDLLDSTWTFTGVYATNTAATSGGRLSAGTVVQVPGWQPGTTNSFAVAGWSSAVAGMDWSTVAGQLSGASFGNGVWSGPNWMPSSSGGFFGVSSLGVGTAPSLASGLPALPIFGTAAPLYGTPIQTGFDLFVINVPEPSGPALVVVCIALSVVKRRWTEQDGGTIQLRQSTPQTTAASGRSKRSPYLTTIPR